MITFSLINPPEETFGIPTVDVGKIERKYLDIPYAFQSPSQKLDIFLPPEGDGPFPTFVFMHGGAFIFGQKQDSQLLHAIEGLNHGYAVVSVEQRLIGEAPYPAGLFDFKAALRFLRANAALYKLDGDRFASGGDSAGGFYAVLAAATQANPAFEDFSMGNASYSSSVQAVVSWYGVYDILVQHSMPHEASPLDDPNFPDIDKLMFGAHSGDIPGLMHFTNPLHFITRAFPPVFIQHGSDDHTVPVRQAYMLEEKVRTVCGAGNVELDILEGFDHGGIDPRSYEKTYAERAFKFLDKYLK